jgi:hypothetical protein
MSPFEQFAHRENGDGTIDSICSRCFVTIANALNEADLKRAETRHICDPAVLGYFESLKKESG